MKIKDIPKENRPRERFLKYGPETLSEAELFAIILRTGTSGENVVDMSNRLIKEYRLDRLFECSLKELQEIKGIGSSKAMQILAMFELGKRYNQLKQLNNKNQNKITCAKDVFDLFHERLKDEKQENFYVLLLNNKNYIIKEELITKGVLDSTIIHPREIFKPAIKNSAARVILIHNHSSGNTTPSKEDVIVTKQIKDASKFIGIELVDHIIIGNENYYSFKQKFLDF